MTRKRRYLISAAGLVACACTALGVLAMLPSRAGITQANFDRIEVGMTRVEAEAILGESDMTLPGVRDHWGHANENQIVIGVRDGNVIHTSFHEKTPEILPDKIRRWLHLPK